MWFAIAFISAAEIFFFAVLKKRGRGLASRTRLFWRAIEVRDRRSALMSGDIPPPEDEDAGRKMTSPWRSERVICLRVCFSSGVSLPLPALKSVSVRHLSTYSLCFMILAWCAAGERVSSIGGQSGFWWVFGSHSESGGFCGLTQLGHQYTDPGRLATRRL